jgi:ubiquinone/menaquinone biosynthesis C-methylase UbiE
VGCGEGYNTRIAAKMGAKLMAIDISEVFIKFAMESEQQDPLGIEFKVASGIDLPFPDKDFDFVMATMSIMDMAENEKAIAEAYRVLKPGGFFQFSIIHPFIGNIVKEWIRDKNGKKIGCFIRDYFKNYDGELEEWIFSAAPKDLTEKMNKFRVPRFTRPLSEWLNLLIDKGFNLERFCEPYVVEDPLKQYPEERNNEMIPWFLIIRCRKPFSR